MGLHESQSLSFEMQLGSHPGFVAPAGAADPAGLRRAAGLRAGQPAPKLLTRVKPGYIRVDADEVTYPAHIILRYEIERPLIEGEIEVEDIPALWDAQDAGAAGPGHRGNFKDGPHAGRALARRLFGYFPCYTLGAMYAAQWFAAMRRAMPDLDARIGRRRPVARCSTGCAPTSGPRASRWTTDELAAAPAASR
jgi:carboxypeptidase Taq